MDSCVLRLSACDLVSNMELKVTRKGIMDTIVDLELQVRKGRPASPDWAKVIDKLKTDCASATKEGYRTFSILVMGIK